MQLADLYPPSLAGWNPQRRGGCSPHKAALCPSLRAFHVSVLPRDGPAVGTVSPPTSGSLFSDNRDGAQGLPVSADSLVALCRCGFCFVLSHPAPVTGRDESPKSEKELAGEEGAPLTSWRRTSAMRPLLLTCLPNVNLAQSDSPDFLSVSLPHPHTPNM